MHTDRYAASQNRHGNIIFKISYRLSHEVQSVMADIIKPFVHLSTILF